jgi:hypothetical protein
MRNSITNQADGMHRWLLLLVGIVGCATSSSLRAARSSQAGDAGQAHARVIAKSVGHKGEAAKLAPLQVQRVQIVDFDCFDPERSAPDLSGASAGRLSRWLGGGPAGSAWNVDTLSCLALVETACEQGVVQGRLQIGQQSVATQRKVVERAGLVRLEYTVQRNMLNRGFDPSVDQSAAPLFQTAVFGLRVELACSKPWEIQPGLGPYRERADFRAFVAGFAVGE